MGWSYDPDRHRFVNGSRVLSEREILAIRNTIADGMDVESAALAKRLIAGEIALAEWARAFAKLIRDGVSAGFLVGRGGAAKMDAASTNALNAIIDDQFGFARQFATDLESSLDAGTATVEGVANRSALYSGASVHAFDQGRSADWGIQLPYFPGDGGTQCLGRCRCEWMIDSTDAGISAIYMTKGDERVCDDCVARGNEYGSGSPFVQLRQEVA